MKRKRLTIRIDKGLCVECGKCRKVCSKVNHPKLCSGCGKCVRACHTGAIRMVERSGSSSGNGGNSNDNNKKNRTMKTRILGHIVLCLLAIAGFSGITMWLWNALLPDIFGVACISFWQALGLLALSRILFGGMTGLMRHLHHHHGAHHHPMHQKWRSMSMEQRKRFIDRRRNFGFGCHPWDENLPEENEHKEAGKGNE